MTTTTDGDLRTQLACAIDDRDQWRVRLRYARHEVARLKRRIETMEENEEFLRAELDKLLRLANGVQIAKGMS